MRWGIIGAMEMEIELTRQSMQDVKETVVSGCRFYEGKIGKSDVVLVCCSIGKVNSALCTQTLIREFKADAVVNTGIAGAIAKQLEICDLVISTDCIYHDMTLSLLEEFPPYVTSFKADQKLIDLVEGACLTLDDRDFKFYHGRIASGDIFVEDSIISRSIVERFDPMCVEMESAAIGHVCFVNKIPFVCIRTMSDNADEHAGKVVVNFGAAAACNASRIVISMVESVKN